MNNWTYQACYRQLLQQTMSRTRAGGDVEKKKLADYSYLLNAGGERDVL